jgi:Mg/Co/Ni transporter MgtE
VVDKEGKLVGLISVDDVMELLTTEFANLIAAIRG